MPFRVPVVLLTEAGAKPRLPNGNTVVTSHHNSAGQVKLMEVARDKKLVWTYTDSRKSGIHHFQILETGGTALKGTPMR